MPEIIRPKFDRKRVQKLRLLHNKPQLAEHPDFKDINKSKPRGLVGLLATILGLTAFFTLLRRR